MTLPWLDPGDRRQPFPHPRLALREPNGLLAAGGCLSPERLLRAYSQGIFPWYDDDTPILWWSPDPRTVLFPDQLKLSRSLRKTLRRTPLHLTMDDDFAAVLEGCAAPRASGAETWLTTEMKTAYTRLYQLGFAHSIEVRQAGIVVGGLYGVALGRIFFGESMFSQVSDASKIALACLCSHLRQWNFVVIDCQLPTEHLHRLGAIDLPRERFLPLLDACGQSPRTLAERWRCETDWLDWLLG